MSSSAAIRTLGPSAAGELGATRGARCDRCRHREARNAGRSRQPARGAICSIEDLFGRTGPVGENSEEGASLIRAEISLIADLNSLQDRKKFPVRVRRELA